MDAKWLLQACEQHPDLLDNASFTDEAKAIIKSALSLAAAVEGPEEACPETDAVRGWDDDGGDTFKLDPSGDMVRVEDCARMERQRNAALRALKAERELLAEACHALRMNDDDLQCETANKINAALAAQEGRHD